MAGKEKWCQATYTEKVRSVEVLWWKAKDSVCVWCEDEKKNEGMRQLRFNWNDKWRDERKKYRKQLH